MRVAGEKKIWQKVFNRSYDYSVEEIDLNGINGIERIEFEKGIFALCGLNGAGKSTVISSLKDILGITTSKLDSKKVNEKNLTGKVKFKEKTIEISNNNSFRLTDKHEDESYLYYLDYKNSIETLEFLDQDNLSEFLEQYEENIITQDLIRKLSYIVGRDYDEIYLTEIESGENIHPYFRVVNSTNEYDSLQMGMGEHFLFYIFWVFYRINNSGIILIEEPETFISIKSQQKLMNFIAEKAGEVGITVIIASHSPYIIRNIKRENIIIISRYQNDVSIIKSPVSEALSSLGLESPKKGIIYVEDIVAEKLLETIIAKDYPHILRDYNIEEVNGHGGITSRLKYPKTSKFTYKILGIYDGDMKEEIKKVKEYLNWNYNFLPVEPSLEEKYIYYIRKNLPYFCDILDIDRGRFIHILSEIEGLDHHDWLINFSRKTGKSLSTLIEVFYEVWKHDPENEQNLNSFMDFLEHHF